jgi:hypothetical protein
MTALQGRELYESIAGEFGVDYDDFGQADVEEINELAKEWFGVAASKKIQLKKLWREHPFRTSKFDI